jgi:hypothetical protein
MNGAESLVRTLVSGGRPFSQVLTLRRCISVRRWTECQKYSAFCDWLKASSPVLRMAAREC